MNASHVQKLRPHHSNHYHHHHHLSHHVLPHQHKNVSLNGALGNSGTQGDGSGSSGCYEQLLVSTKVFLALGVLSLAENILVVAAVVKNRNLHSPMYFFLCSLAVADMLVSVSNATEAVVMAMLTGGGLRMRGSLVESMDNLFDSMICTSLLASIWSLLAVAVECMIVIYEMSCCYG
ncbi:melanocortin receptor 4 [Alosa alosa]|uniref:melanocortin receptor 4 n=1 Tax=Alosa alosa TaxID=278164 RepID=UPI0020153E9B|nr:melanocortin receptor 4 [Alosa alosa]